MTLTTASIYNAVICLTQDNQQTVIEQLVRARPINQLLFRQSIALVVIFLSLLVWQGWSTAFAASFGAVIGVVNTLLMKWHLMKTAMAAGADPAKNMSGIYRCVAERWVLTLILFATGFVVLNLSALPLLLGFIAMQFIVLFGNTRQA